MRSPFSGAAISGLTRLGVSYHLPNKTRIAAFYSIVPKRTRGQPVLLTDIEAKRTVRGIEVCRTGMNGLNPLHFTNNHLGDFLMLTSIASIFNLVGPDMIIVLLIVLLLFGAKKLPELARGMGRAVKEFSAARDEIERGLGQSNASEPKLADTKAE